MANTSRWGQAAPRSGTRVPHVPWQGNPGGARALPERSTASCACSCGSHVAAGAVRPRGGACVCVCVHTPVTVQACTHRDGSSRCRQPRTGAARSRGALAGLPRDAGAGVALTRVAFSCPRATPSGLVPEQAGNGLLVTRRGFARQAGISYKRPRRTRESFRWAPVTQELQQFSPGHKTFLPVAQFLTEC